MASDSSEKAKVSTVNADRKLILSAGFVCLLCLVSFGYWVNTTSLPTPNLQTTADRLAFALKWQSLSVLTVVAGIIWVGNTRFLTPAINPLDEAGKKYVEIPVRYLGNTTEQFLLHFVACLTLSIHLPLDKMMVLPLLTVWFVVARVVFAIGYSIRPVFRAPGFTLTFSPTVFSLAYCNYCLYVEYLK